MAAFRLYTLGLSALLINAVLAISTSCVAEPPNTTPTPTPTIRTTSVPSTLTWNHPIWSKNSTATHSKTFETGSLHLGLQSSASWVGLHAASSPGTNTMSRPVATVTVGDSGKPRFTPSTLNASVGSVIAFDFLGLNHTLTQSELENPCHSNSGFDSGFRQYNPANTSGRLIVKYRVTTGNPTWFFCSQVVPRSHCQAGMVFSLNSRGRENQFLSSALAAVPAYSSQTGLSCQSPARNTSTSFPSGTASANPGISSSIIFPIISSTGSLTQVSTLVFWLALGALVGI
jgi:plastocyanin